jgi:hypothetical protein
VVLRQICPSHSRQAYFFQVRPAMLRGFLFRCIAKGCLRKQRKPNQSLLPFSEFGSNESCSKREYHRQLGHGAESIPQGLKPARFLRWFAARLKPCPFKTDSKLEDHRQGGSYEKQPQILRLRSRWRPPLRMTSREGVRRDRMAAKAEVTKSNRRSFDYGRGGDLLSG